MLGESRVEDRRPVLREVAAAAVATDKRMRVLPKSEQWSSSSSSCSASASASSGLASLRMLLNGLQDDEKMTARRISSAGDGASEENGKPNGSGKRSGRR